MKFLLLILAMTVALSQQVMAECTCADCDAVGCECVDCGPGKCVCDDCPSKPALLLPAGERPVDVDDLYGPQASQGASDDEWKSDVEAALQYLHRRQNDHEARISKLEEAIIQVRSTSGQVAKRSVPIQNGTGYFDLAPGETLVGYQDPMTNQWVNVQQTQPTMTTSNYRSDPVQVYRSSPTTEMRMISQTRRYPVRGRIRVRAMTNCATCG